MQHRWIRVGGVILGTFSALLPANAGSRQQRPPSVFDAVPGIERTVSLGEPKIPLGELVQQVAAATGVPLSAAREVADEPVAVSVTEFPARQLLEELGDLLDYQWRRVGRPGAWRYEIGQDRASREREQALRNVTTRAVERQFQQELDHLGEMAARSQAQLRAIIDAGSGARAGSSSPQESERNRRFRTAQRLSSPILWAVARLLGRLSPQEWAVLREQGQLLFTSDAQPGELPLPADIVQTLRASQPSLYAPGGRPSEVGDGEVEEQLRQAEATLQEQWVAAGYQVTIRLDTTAFESSGLLSLSAQAAPLSGAAPLPAPFAGSDGTRLHVNAVPADFQEWAAADTPQRRAELEKDPVVGVERRFTLQPPGPGKVAGRRFRELLPELARTYGVQFISDAYSDPHLIPTDQLTPKAPTALFTLLDRLAGFTHRWDRRGNLVRLRSRRWFLARPREIPLRWARHWKALCEQQGALPLEEYLTMVGQLNERQLAGLGDLCREVGLPPDLANVYPVRHVLRLYISLPPVQQQALWKRQAIPLTEMTVMQRGLFFRALQELTRYQIVPLSPARWVGASLLLTSERVALVKEPRGGTTDDRTEPVTPAGRKERISPAPTSGHVPPTAPKVEAGSSRSPLPMSVAEQQRVARHPVTSLTFYLPYGPGLREQVSLTVASLP